jgi:hypothetical protein
MNGCNAVKGKKANRMAHKYYAENAFAIAKKEKKIVVEI